MHNTAEELWRRRWGAVAIIALVIGGAASPAAADDRGYWYPQSGGTQIVYRGSPYVDNICIGADSYQNHPWLAAGGTIGRTAHTLSLRVDGNCSWFDQDPGRIAQRGNLFHNGALCQQGGWQYNSPPPGQQNHDVYWSTGENLYYNPYCGGSAWITQDLYHAVWSPWTQTAYYADSPKPTTGHQY